MALYKRRRSKERPMSMFTGSASPVLLSFKASSCSPTYSEPADLSDEVVSDESGCGLDSTLTSFTKSDSFEQYDLEIAELQHSPTLAGKKIWSFSTPAISPATSKRSGGLSGSPSPDVTPIASHDPMFVSHDESIPPSPASTVSSTLQQFAARLNGTNSSSVLESPGNDKRSKVISEIMKTERKYISDLEILLNVYLPALETEVAARELRLLFPCQLEPLVERHISLLAKLEERMSDNTLFPGIVGDLFARLLRENNGDFTNMYSAYMNEFKVAMTTMARYEQTSNDFKELLMLCQQHELCDGGLGLASYLLSPVQRLPRYELLMKELLKQTPLDHPDNFYVTDAIELIHSELLRLNQSIKSCQLACSVRRATKPSFKNRAIAKIKRHVSIANMEDYSSSDSGTGAAELRASRAIRRRRGALKPSSYRSEENLPGMMDPRTPLRVKSLVSVRPASSLVDLAVSFDEATARAKHFNRLTPLESLPVTPDASPRPFSPSECSTNPVTSEEGSRRFSTYSTASSTSGIGSIDNSLFDLRISTPDPTGTSTPVMNRVNFRVDFPVSMMTGARGEGQRIREKSGLKRKVSFSKALKKLGKKKSFSSSKVLDIGSPKNFRHIQHGFPSLPEDNEQTCTSNTSSSNTLNAVSS